MKMILGISGKTMQNISINPMCMLQNNKLGLLQMIIKIDGKYI